MPSHEQEKSISERISQGEVTMRPRLYFVLRTAAFIVAILLLFCVAIYLGSSLFLITHHNGSFLFTNFGWKGLLRFVFSLPWIIIGLVAILIVLAELLSWHFTNTYRKPFLVSMVGIFLLVCLMSLLVGQSHLHDFIYQRRLPVFRPFYEHFEGAPPEGIHFATVVEQNGSIWTVESIDGKRWQVMISSNTRLPQQSVVRVGDCIVIFGDWDDQKITAEGIQKLDEHNYPNFIHRSPEGDGCTRE